MSTFYCLAGTWLSQTASDITELSSRPSSQSLFEMKKKHSENSERNK